MTARARWTTGVRLGLCVSLLITTVVLAAETLSITARQAVVRAGPEGKSAILTTLPQGTTLALLERHQGWYKVLLDDGREGWMGQAAAQVQVDSGARLQLPGSTTTEAPPSSRPGFYRQSWAVVVGVNRFRNRSIPTLHYAVNDAQSVAQALTTVGFPAANITTLLDGQATKGEVERLLSSVIRKATSAEDRLLIFFATHGTTAALPGGGEEGYLLLHDADPTDLPFTALGMSALKQMGQRIPARHILVAVDACYGGYSLVRSQGPTVPDPRYLALLVQSRVIQVLTAGRKNQLVVEERGHGVFTRKFLDGLLGHADSNRDGILTGQELAAWMHPRVAQASDNTQDMQFGNLDGEGQFFFVVPAGPQVAVGSDPRPLSPSVASQSESSPGQDDVQQILTYAMERGGIDHEAAIAAAQRRIEARKPRPLADRATRQRARAANEQGRSAIQESRVADAIRAFQEASTADPTDAEIIANLGYAYLFQGDLQTAEFWLLRALILAPGRSTTWATLAHVYAAQGNPRGAVACLANAYRFSPKREVTRKTLESMATAADNDQLREAASQTLQLQLLQVGKAQNLHSTPSR